MGLPVRVYAVVMMVIAAAVTVVDLTAVSDWTHTWTPFSAVVLLSLYVIAVHFKFKVHSGWTTDASTVPAVATALLLPPGLVMLIACISLVTYSVVGRRRVDLKGVFNAAS